jgi:hypothetical protein
LLAKIAIRPTDTMPLNTLANAVAGKQGTERRPSVIAGPFVEYQHAREIVQILHFARLLVGKKKSGSVR